MKNEKLRAGRNRTLTLQADEIEYFSSLVLRPDQINPSNFLGRTILGDYAEAVKKIPESCVDLLILDPPYNLNKKFGANSFSKMGVDEYADWLRVVFKNIFPVLKKNATVYICGDWFSSASIFQAAADYFIIRNRITWEREKGRGALTNWKNSSEDIWFCTTSNNFTFNVEAVKLRRKVIAPYRNIDGTPKDWLETEDGNFRDTHPSNLWTDITIPFWSMPENTDHPTQKSEKLIAKLILASTNPGDVVFDPFLGSGTSSVVAQKLGRRFFGIEIDETYALLTQKRLERAKNNQNIQGYYDQVFWERNSLNMMKLGELKSRINETLE